MLAVFRVCFTVLSFLAFTSWVAGMIARPDRVDRVRDVWWAAGLAGVWHHTPGHVAVGTWPLKVGLEATGRGGSAGRFLF